MVALYPCKETIQIDQLAGFIRNEIIEMTYMYLFESANISGLSLSLSFCLRDVSLTYVGGRGGSRGGQRSPRVPPPPQNLSRGGSVCLSV